MEYYAVGIAILGAAVGIRFRWKVLLPIIGLLLSASIIFSISRSLSFLEAALIVIVAQAILQGGYFAGLFVRAIIASAYMRSARWTSNKGRRDSEVGGKDQRTAPSQGPAKSRDLF